jgi:ATP-dependent Clp protease ATP-binding subunit ClpC
VDELVVFNPLMHEDLTRIVKLQIAEVSKRLADKGVTLDVEQPALDFLIKQGWNEDYGARPLRRAIERNIEDPLAEHMLKNGHLSGIPVKIKLAEGADKLVFEQEAEPEKAVAAAPGETPAP